MQQSAVIERDTNVQRTLDFLEEALSSLKKVDFAVQLWNGVTWGPGHGQPSRFRLVLRHPGSLRAMLSASGSAAFGEAYIFDDFDIEGDIEHMLAVGERLLADNSGTAAKLRTALKIATLPSASTKREPERAARLAGQRHGKSRDRQAVRYHYDVPCDFYREWLDDRMVYSCAYFEEAGLPLDEAQAGKLDYICRKLRLDPGDRLLDVGCGWGGLILHACANYGVEATGITLSEPQAREANRRIQEAGLADRCRAEVRDYRDADGAGSWDRIVSVGMFEHVGKAMLPQFFGRAYDLLRPGGVFLNHGIAISGVRSRTGGPSYRESGPSFIERYVFPDGELVPIGQTICAAEDAGFEIRDVESLREHYALTLRHWVRNLEASHESLLQHVDEPTYRIWRAYMAASAYGFASAYINVYQTLMVRPDGGTSGLPLTRADWYS